MSNYFKSMGEKLDVYADKFLVWLEGRLEVVGREYDEKVEDIKEKLDEDKS